MINTKIYLVAHSILSKYATSLNGTLKFLSNYYYMTSKVSCIFSFTWQMENIFGKEIHTENVYYNLFPSCHGCKKFLRKI